MRAVREAIDRVATAHVILLVGWVWFVVYAFPGYMSYDSVWQLEQARHLQLVNEWQPPLMAFIWQQLDHVISGPILMLVLQSGTFLLGLYAILRHVMRDRRAAIVAVVVLLVIPQNIIVMAVIWKDSQMAGFLIAAIAALLSTKRPWRITGYVFVFLATGVRYNAAAATLPIILGLFATSTGWRRYAMATGLWLGITAAAFITNGMLVENKTYPWQTAAAPADIAGVIRFAHDLDNDQLLEDTKGVPWVHTDKLQSRVRTWYRPESQILTLSQGPGAIFEYPTTEAQRAAISAAWSKLVPAHPWAFARHRLAVFRAQLAVTGSIWSGFSNAAWGEDKLGHRATHSWLQQIWVHAMDELLGTWVYTVWMYFLLGLAFLPLCRGNRLAAIILISGTFHELGLLLVAPAVDYRYSHWMIACTIIGGILVFVKRYGLTAIATRFKP